MSRDRDTERHRDDHAGRQQAKTLETCFADFDQQVPGTDDSPPVPPAV